MKMKPIEHISPRCGDGFARLPQAPVVPRVYRRDSGVALLIVLGMLVLLSVIVVAFITSVTTDLADSAGQ